MKFNFDSKLYFSYFFDSWFDIGERKQLDFGDKKYAPSN